MPGGAGTSWINLEKLFGTKPEVPPVTRLNLPEEQLAAINANIAAAPKAAELARMSQEQIRQMMNFAIPGFSGMVGQTSSNIADALKGVIPVDVSEAVQRNAAASSLAGGFGGSGMSRNLVARDLGLTSLQQQRYGQTALQGWLGAMEALYAPSQALYSSSFITPQQQYAVERGEENLQFSRNWLQSQINAMPDPVARGVYDTVLELVNSYLGGSHQSFNPQQSTAAAAGTNYGGPGGGAGGALWGSSGAYAPTGAGGGAGFGGSFDSSIGGIAAGGYF